jgi:nucleoside-diphosphate-sugar epimerase
MQIVPTPSKPRLTGRRVVVTGARGFIGRRLLAALVRDGAQVTAILRSGHDAGDLRRQGAAVTIAEMNDSPAMRRCMAGCDTLFHFAYDMRAPGTANLAAFRAVLDAARQAGIARIVHASSAVVYDTWPDGRIGPETAITPGGGDYRRTKIAMEQMLLEGPVPAAILQPTIVYGPGSALWTVAPMTALARGGVVLPDPVGLCPAVFVDDIAEAALRAALLPDLTRERFLLSGPDTITWLDFYTAYAGIVGQGSVLQRPLAELAARLGPAAVGPAAGPAMAARISAVLRRVIGSRRFEAGLQQIRSLRRATGPAYPDRASLALFAANPTIDLSRTESRLGYVPTTRFAEGLSAIRSQSR